MMHTNSELTSILTQLISTNGNCVNLGRHLLVKNPQLVTDILAATRFLPDSAKFTERLYCVTHDISCQTLNAFGNPARFINLFRGYSLLIQDKLRFDKKQERLAEKHARDRLVTVKPSKLEEWIRRNKKRNKHLYEEGKVEGYDYVVCPISNVRMNTIKSDYITSILDMQISDYPLKQRSCTKRSENIKAGIHKIDVASGLTVHALGVIQAKKTLSTVDENGKRGYDRLGAKTRATHMANVDKFGRNGFQQQANARLTTVLSNGLTVEQNAHVKQKETLAANGITRSMGASKISKKNLSPIITYLNSLNVKYYFDQSEYVVLDPDTKNYYYYDLTIPSSGITIEYQSNAWHANPVWDSVKWNTWQPPRGRKKSATDALTYDYIKARALYKTRGIVTYYVWEDSLDQDIKEILCLLQTINMKS